LIGAFLEDESISAKLLSLRRAHEPSVYVVGPMADYKVYTTYLSLLEGSQSVINMPMLATAPEALGSLDVITSRAQRGVVVRILLGSPKLISRVRGGVVGESSKKNIKHWKNIVKKSKRIKVRVSNVSKDMIIGTCMSIDGRVLRLDVYDFMKQRSKEGIMLEASATDGRSLNIIEMFDIYFEQAWVRARPIDLIGSMLWYFSKNWHFILFFVFGISATAILYMFPLDMSKSGILNLVFGILTSASGSFLVTGIVDSWEKIRGFLRRFSWNGGS
jgi:hypothetical protein